MRIYKARPKFPVHILLSLHAQDFFPAIAKRLDARNVQHDVMKSTVCNYLYVFLFKWAGYNTPLWREKRAQLSIPQIFVTNPVKTTEALYNAPTRMLLPNIIGKWTVEKVIAENHIALSF